METKNKKTSNPILQSRNLTKRFGGLHALNKVDLDLYDGEILGLIGTNGAGKTTFLNVISGFLSPTEGRVIFMGKDVTRFPAHSMAKKGIVRTFQSTILFEGHTVLDNVIIGHHLQEKARLWSSLLNLSSYRRGVRETKEQSLQVLEKVGLIQVKDKDVSSLPHGYRRLVGIAIALSAQPKLLLLDEPVTGMNAEEITQTMRCIRKLLEDGITVLLVEHNMRAVMATCDRIVVLNFGKKLTEGSPDDIRRNKDVIKAYLGTEE